MSVFDNMGFDGIITQFIDDGFSMFDDSEVTGKRVIEEVSQAGIASLQGHGAPKFIGVTGGDDKWEWHYIKAIDGEFDYGIGDAPGIKNSHGRMVYHRYEYNNSFDIVKGHHSPGILYSLACHTVPLDTFGEEGGTHSIGSAYTAAGLFGGVAYIGNTRSGFFRPESSSKMEAEFGRGLKNHYTIGRTHIQSLSLNVYKKAKFTNILIGDPELVVWTGIPKSYNITLSDEYNSLRLNSTDLPQSKYIIYNGIDNGNDNIRVGAINENSQNLILNSSELSLGNNPNESGILSQLVLLKLGFIPYHRLFVSNANINTSRTFVLSNDVILNGVNSQKITLANNGNLLLRCLKKFTSNNTFTVESGAKLIIDSDETVALNKDLVKSGGELIISGAEVKLESGFSVEKNATMKIQIKKQ